jgi:hypothetical protein
MLSQMNSPIKYINATITQQNYNETKCSVIIKTQFSAATVILEDDLMCLNSKHQFYSDKK